MDMKNFFREERRRKCALSVFVLFTTYDFSNKTISTHGGSGKERAFNDIKRLCEKSTVRSGYERYEKGDRKQIIRWLDTI